MISTWSKSGTTWMQQIVAQLLFNGAEDWRSRRCRLGSISACRQRRSSSPHLEAQTHRRFIKTHLPVDALVYSPRAKYIYIGRDGRDVMWSMHNHWINGNATIYAAINDTPGRVGPPFEPPPASPREYFLTWLERDGYPFSSFWENVRSWWAIRDLPNLLLLHFEQLRADMPGEIRRIAEFLDVPIDQSIWPAIVAHCSSIT